MRTRIVITTVLFAMAGLPALGTPAAATHGCLQDTEAAGGDDCVHLDLGCDDNAANAGSVETPWGTFGITNGVWISGCGNDADQVNAEFQGNEEHPGGELEAIEDVDHCHITGDWGTRFGDIVIVDPSSDSVEFSCGPNGLFEGSMSGGILLVG